MKDEIRFDNDLEDRDSRVLGSVFPIIIKVQRRPSPIHSISIDAILLSCLVHEPHPPASKISRDRDPALYHTEIS